MRLYSLCFLLLLSACATEYPMTQFRVVWVDNPHRACDGGPLGTTLGCARVEGGICTIRAARPASERDARRFETLGHELLHCVEGPWHDRMGKMLQKNHNPND